MSDNKKVVIAVDGYSSCGKSTFAKLIAKEVAYIYIDTGAMYRAVTLHAMNNGYINSGVVNSPELIKGLPQLDIKFKYNVAMGKSETLLNGKNVEEEIRKEFVSANVSLVSAIKEVRVKLVQLQQEMGKDKGVVLDGRDIGTVVFPDAELKIFMTADPKIRAKRRYDEIVSKGQSANLEQVEKELKNRDHIDTTRKESPLVKADDALILDNSKMTVEEQMDWFKEKYASVGN